VILDGKDVIPLNHVAVSLLDHSSNVKLGRIGASRCFQDELQAGTWIAVDTRTAQICLSKPVHSMLASVCLSRSNVLQSRHQVVIRIYLAAVQNAEFRLREWTPTCRDAVSCYSSSLLEVISYPLVAVRRAGSPNGKICELQVCITKNKLYVAIRWLSVCSEQLFQDFYAASVGVTTQAISSC
jgi:hypothetical protein